MIGIGFVTWFVYNSTAIITVLPILSLTVAWITHRLTRHAVCRKTLLKARHNLDLIAANQDMRDALFERNTSSLVEKIDSEIEARKR